MEQPNQNVKIAHDLAANRKLIGERYTNILPKSSTVQATYVPNTANGTVNKGLGVSGQPKTNLKCKDFSQKFPGNRELEKGIGMQTFRIQGSVITQPTILPPSIQTGK